jgi:hypothetical protein
MIEAERLTLRGKIVYDNVQILMPDEQKDRGLDNILGDNQIVFKCKDGWFITTNFHLMIVHLNSHRVKFLDCCSRRMKRVTLSGDNVYSPVCLLNRDVWDEMGIPAILKPSEQFVFACPDGLFVANIFHVLNVEV